jgi:hypothetical protein
MKTNHLKSRGALIALSLGLAVLPAANTQAAIASYIIGVDGQQTIPSGTYAGLPNPNFQRLTFLYAHYDLVDVNYPHHYHSKSRLVYSGPAANPVEVNLASNFLPEASGGTHLFLSPSTVGPYAGKSPILEVTGNEFSFLRILDVGKLDSTVTDPRSVEEILFNSSSGRWSGLITGADVHMVLVSATPGLNFGTPSNPNADVFGNLEGEHLADDIDFTWVPWVDSSTANGTEFIAQFKLVDEEGSFGDSGVFEFRFMSVPEPSTALLGAIGALALLRRRR